jgi:hypothetical protein
MARFTDYRSDSEVSDIMEGFVDKFPEVFDGFDVDGIRFIVTQKKKNPKEPVKLRAMTYPNEVFVGKPYIVEVFEDSWNKLNGKKKNLMVFRTMCAIPPNGFDPESKYYAKKVKPQIVMYDLEFAAAGGVPNWMENDLAVDPMETTKEEMAEHAPKVVEVEGDPDPIPDEPSGPKANKKKPVTVDSIAGA